MGEKIGLGDHYGIQEVPHGGEQIGVLGIGTSGLMNCSDTEIEQIIRCAIELGVVMTRYKCIQYALDHPGVRVVVPGVRNLTDLQKLIGFADAPKNEKDYSVICNRKIYACCG